MLIAHGMGTSALEETNVGGQSIVRVVGRSACVFGSANFVHGEIGMYHH